MTSAAQTEANRANAQHSTGPKTPEGKQRVSANALKHGLSAREINVGDDERETFDEFHASLIEEIAPDGAVQTTIFNQIVHSAWNLRRARIMEAELSQTGDPLTDDVLARKLDRLSAHQTRLDRAFHRGLREIKALQTNRVFTAFCEERTGEPVPPMADAKEVLKQTQKLSVDAVYEQVFGKMTRQDRALIAHLHAEASRRDAEKTRQADSGVAA